MSTISILNWRIDLHVHTRRHSPCAEGLDPETLAERMQQAGLHGLVITEHDLLWPAAQIAQLNRDLDHGRIYRGMEVSSRNGHFILIGLDDHQAAALTPGISIGDLLAKLPDDGTCVIWAHPFHSYAQTPDPLTSAEMPDGIHAVEVASGVTGGKDGRRAVKLARQRGWATVGGSDAHALDQVGCAYTLFEELPADEQALATAIRDGRCRAERPPASPAAGRTSCC